MAFGNGPRRAYTLLPAEEEHEFIYTSSKWQRLPCIITILIITNAISILSTYYFCITRVVFAQEGSLDLPGLERVYTGLDRSTSTVQFSEFGGAKPSRWTAAASREVDIAWKELGVSDLGFYLPEALGREIFNLDRRKHVYFPKGHFMDPEEEAFPLIVQATHDLHCLNELRKGLYYNYDYYRQFHNDTLVSPQFRIWHSNHCIDNIRERLMCTADLGVIPNIWIGPDETTIQFGREHKCHNYDAVMGWLKSRGILSDPTKYIKRPGMELTTAPPDAILSDPRDFGKEVV